MRTSHSISRRALERTAAAARRRYARGPNVLGAGVGPKLVDGRPSAVRESVQFFVRRKTKSRARTRAPLPRFVWLRGGRGRRRIATDVIEVGRVDFACLAGTALATTGRAGVATLVFRNKVAGDPACYVVTCAHVVGDLRNPQTGAEVTGECCAGGPDGVLARTVAMTGIEGDRVRYDVALARMTPPCAAQPDCAVPGEPDCPVRRFVPGAAIAPGTTVRIALRGDTTLTGGVLSVGAVEVGGVLVENLCLTNVPVRFGDSGALVYRDEAALGILVARSGADGFGWFQPLGDALAHASRQSGLAVACFADEEAP